MKKFIKKIEEILTTTALAEYEGLEELRNEMEESAGVSYTDFVEIPHAEAGELQAIKSAVKGHGEQMVLPDDCQFGDNDLCFVEA